MLFFPPGYPNPSIPRGAVLKKSKKRQAKTLATLKLVNSTALWRCRSSWAPPAGPLVAPRGTFFRSWFILGSLGVVSVCFWSAFGAHWAPLGALWAPVGFPWGALGALWGCSRGPPVCFWGISACSGVVHAILRVVHAIVRSRHALGFRVYWFSV